MDGWIDRCTALDTCFTSVAVTESRGRGAAQGRKMGNAETGKRRSQQDGKWGDGNNVVEEQAEDRGRGGKNLKESKRKPCSSQSYIGFIEQAESSDAQGASSLCVQQMPLLSRPVSSSSFVRSLLFFCFFSLLFIFKLEPTNSLTAKSIFPPSRSR